MILREKKQLSRIKADLLGSSDYIRADELEYERYQTSCHFKNQRNSAWIKYTTNLVENATL